MNSRRRRDDPIPGGFTITLMSGGNIRRIGQNSTIEFAKDMAANYDVERERHARALRPRRRRPNPTCYITFIASKSSDVFCRIP